MLHRHEVTGSNRILTSEDHSGAVLVREPRVECEQDSVRAVGKLVIKNFAENRVRLTFEQIGPAVAMRVGGRMTNRGRTTDTFELDTTTRHCPAASEVMANATAAIAISVERPLDVRKSPVLLAIGIGN